MSMKHRFTRMIVVPLVTLMMGCGDRLADANYRGEPLFEMTGSTRPASEFDGNEYLCSLEIDECFNECLPYGPLTDPADIDDNGEDPNIVCFNECDAQYTICLDNNAGISFTEAYYSNQTGQRIAVLWAQPKPGQGDAPTTLSQRGVTTTGFPSRYTFSVYHPPPQSVLFDHGAGAFAYGLMVSYYDVNQDERLDVANEPIIGFNATSAIVYTPAPVTGTDGSHYIQGYHLRTLGQFCSLGDIFDASAEVIDEMRQQDRTLIEISGTTPNIFNWLPDLGCDEDQSEWLSLCSAPAHSARCSGERIPEIYQPICAFCSGQNKSLTGPDMAVPLDGEELDACALMDEPDSLACEREQEYSDCLARTEDEEQQADCESLRDNEATP